MKKKLLRLTLGEKVTYHTIYSNLFHISKISKKIELFIFVSRLKSTFISSRFRLFLEYCTVHNINDLFNSNMLHLVYVY